jgi:hypothetical protein
MEKLIAQLEHEVLMGVHQDMPLYEKSWQNKEGVLLSIANAQEILTTLKFYQNAEKIQAVLHCDHDYRITASGAASLQCRHCGKWRIKS